MADIRSRLLSLRRVSAVVEILSTLVTSVLILSSTSHAQSRSMTETKSYYFSSNALYYFTSHSPILAQIYTVFILARLYRSGENRYSQGGRSIETGRAEARAEFMGRGQPARSQPNRGSEGAL